MSIPAVEQLQQRNQKLEARCLKYKHKIQVLTDLLVAFAQKPDSKHVINLTDDDDDGEIVIKSTHVIVDDGEIVIKQEPNIVYEIIETVEKPIVVPIKVEKEAVEEEDDEEAVEEEAVEEEAVEEEAVEEEAVEEEAVEEEAVDEEAVEEDAVEEEAVEEEEEEEAVEEEEEEEEEEVNEVTIEGKKYYTNNEQCGTIYSIISDGDVGDEIGIFKNGKAVFHST